MLPANIWMECSFSFLSWYISSKSKRDLERKMLSRWFLNFLFDSEGLQPCCCWFLFFSCLYFFCWIAFLYPMITLKFQNEQLPQCSRIPYLFWVFHKLFILQRFTGEGKNTHYFISSVAHLSITKLLLNIFNLVFYILIFAFSSFTEADIDIVPDSINLLVPHHHHLIF